MTGNVYGRRMFHMANGGMMPPMAGGMPEGMPPSMPPMAGGMPEGMPPSMPPEMLAGMPEELPLEVEQAADNVMIDGLKEGIAKQTDESVGSLNAAMDFRDVMNIVWDQNADVETYRARLSEVVGPEDANRTPDSVLALVQPTLQIAEIDKGVAGLMKQELSEVDGMGDGLMALATKGAMSDAMTSETGALVNAVGGMSNGGGSMEDMMMAAVQGEMAPGPAPMDQGPMPMDPEIIY